MSNEPLAYSQTQRPVGFPIAFTLEGERLKVDSTRKVHDVRLDAVEEVRLTYEARSFARAAYRTTLRLKGGKTVSFSSVTWVSMIEAKDQNEAYRAFAGALLAAVARANPGARFITGKPRLVWLALAAMAALTLVAMAAFAWRAFQSGAAAAGALGLAVGAVGVWQLEPMVRLNLPGAFRPEAPPAALMP